jgi:hypothetical protein
MPELKTPAGDLVEAERSQVEVDFARAMAEDPAEAQAPPKRPVSPAGSQAGSAAPKRRGRPPKSEQPRVTAAAAAPLSDEQRAAGVAGIVQLGATLCGISSRVTGSAAFTADAITLANSAPDWGSAAAQVARADPKFARVVDKISSAGPYGALVTVAMATGMQLARNHRPDAQLPGTVPPAELIATAISEQEQQPMGKHAAA